MLLLGSGISLPSGLPPVETITEQILNGDWHGHTDSNFYKGLLQPGQRDWKVERQKKFLKCLKEHADQYQQHRRWNGANYEDLYYLVRQIEDEFLGEIDNPAIRPFVEALKKETRELCEPKATETEFSLRELASESQDYISSIVWHLLGNKSIPQNLDAVRHLAQFDSVEKLDIASLNHDLLIESLLQQSGINFVDGFADADGDVRHFEPETFDNPVATVNLYKLHGSINWWRFVETKNRRDVIRYGIHLRMPPWDGKNSRGTQLHELDPRPVFLCGSYNKLFDYRYGIFAELHFRFFRLLRQHELIVMSGYGWNDRGINGWLSEWLSSGRKNKIILLHNHPEHIRDNSKSFMWHRYASLRKQGRLIVVRKWLTDISGEQLVKIIRDGSR